MIQNVENQGPCRKSYSLARRPPVIYSARRRGEGDLVPIFEPYEENLPLESGYYSFVLDEEGRFRVKRGNLSSHSTMVGGAGVGAAGRFRINRAGNIAEVVCRSLDYRISLRGPSSPTVAFVIHSFVEHHALEVSQWAIFQFSKGMVESFYVDGFERPIDDLEARLARLDLEGQGDEILPSFTDKEIRRYSTYRPETPPRLYGMHLDQLILAVEADDASPFEYGPAMPRYSPDSIRLNSGKKAFVIDPEGWLIIGPYGHHLLSGGGAVGGAGQIVLDESGLISEINLNFSGHYRPPLDACYARYVYQALTGHPLLSFAPGYKISGRKFDERGELSTVLRFDESEFASENSDLEFLIELASL